MSLAAKKEVAEQQRGGVFVGRRRYRPQQWDEVTNWHLYPFGGGESWFGFETVRYLHGLPPDILLVPLAGHTWGHAGVAIREASGKWLLHAADAYFYRGEVGIGPYRCTPGLRGYQKLMEVDRQTRLHNQQRLRRLAKVHAGEVRIICAHDAVEFDILAEVSLSQKRGLGQLSSPTAVASHPEPAVPA